MSIIRGIFDYFMLWEKITDEYRDKDTGFYFKVVYYVRPWDKSRIALDKKYEI